MNKPKKKGTGYKDMMNQDIEKILFSRDDIQKRVSELATEITRDYAHSHRQLVMLIILKGSMPFATDLMREMPLPMEVECMKVSSYGAATKNSGEIKITLDLMRDGLNDLDILIVEDIVDSGRTLARLTQLLRNRGANSVKTVTLLDKPERREVPFTPDYCGFTVPNEFVVGYGLDYAEKYRNLPYVGVLKASVYS